MAESSVWKITKDDKTLYIGGTIHYLSANDFPLPETFDKAYDKSSVLVFETDIQKAKSLEFQQMILKRMMYSDGKNLKQVLNENTLLRLEKHLACRGLPLAGMLTFKPSMVALTITVLEMQRLGLAEAGVDEFYSKKAINDKKELGKLETIEQQLDFLVNMGKGNEDEMLQYTIKDMEELPNMLQLMKNAWRSGNDKELYKLGIKPFKKDFPGVYKSLLVDRNIAWMPQIDAFLEDEAVEFILVGALHLIGEDGIIEMLKHKGYLVEML